MYESWKGKRSQKNLQNLVDAFRMAVRNFHPDDVDEAKMSNFDKKYVIKDSNMFNDIIVYTLTDFRDYLDEYLGYDEDIKAEFRYKPVFKAVEIFIDRLVHCLGMTLESLHDEQMLCFVLQQAQRLAHYTSFGRKNKKFVGELINLWSSHTHSEKIRILAFININSVVTTNSALLSPVIKRAYLNYVKNSKFINAQTMSNISFMRSCVVELLSINFVESYQRAFEFLRQISLHVRVAFTSKQKDRLAPVLNWQIINSLDVFVKLLCRHGDQPELSLLRHPLVQVVHAMLDLCQATVWYPARIVLLKMLNELILKGEKKVLANTASYVLKLINHEKVTCKPVHSKKKKDSAKPLVLGLILKISDKDIGTRPYQESVISESVYLLTDYYSVYATNPCFPEMSQATVLEIKKVLQKLRPSPAKTKLEQLRYTLEDNARYIQAKRQAEKLDCGNEEKAKLFAAAITSTPVTKFKQEIDTQRAAMVALMKQAEEEKAELIPKKRRDKKGQDSFDYGDDSYDSADGLDDEGFEGDEASGEYNSIDEEEGGYGDEGDSYDGIDEEQEEQPAPAPKKKRQLERKERKGLEPKKRKTKQARHEEEDIVEDINLDDF